MASMMVYRLPTGITEYRLSDKAPKVGDVLSQGDNNWIVAEVQEQRDGTTLITVRPELKSA